MILFILVSCRQPDLISYKLLRVTYNCSSSLYININPVSTQPLRLIKLNITHLEPALIGTASFAFSINVFPDELAAAPFLLPPDLAAYPMAATENRVPSVRYSVFMARPNMTLGFRNYVSNKWQRTVDKGTYYDMARGLIEVLVK
jgi:hypothetical protein